MTVIWQLLHLLTYIIRKIFISFFNISTYLFKFSIIPESLYTYIIDCIWLFILCFLSVYLVRELDIVNAYIQLIIKIPACSTVNCFFHMFNPFPEVRTYLMIECIG